MRETRQFDPRAFFHALRNRILLIAGLAVLLCLLSVAVTFFVTPRYTSRALVQVAPQVLPQGYVKPIVTEKLADRIATLEQRVMTRARLLPIIERFKLTRDESLDKVVDQVRTNISVAPAEPGSSPSSSSNSKKKVLDRNDVPGFYVLFTWDNARLAQQICSEVTSMILDENVKIREQVGQNTTEFLSRQLEQAKHDLDLLDSQLANFKREHLGRLPGEVENNLKILEGLTSQLDASTQALNQAQQEKSFSESLLAQETAAWRSTQEAPNLPSLREQLINLKNQVVTLRTRYTDEHPDVVKARKDIAEIQQELRETTAEDEKAHSILESRVKMEPPEVLRLREKIHQEDIAMDRATAEQSRLKEQINSYQGRLALSPDVEEQYKKLTRDSETAHSIYASLLTNEKSAEIQTAMEREQQGEQIKLLEAASLPDSPIFPVRWMFALGGCVAGLALGVGLVFLQETTDRSLRTQDDVENLLNLPALASVPYATGNEGSHPQRTWTPWKRPLSV
jgi:uncharacterized protein involved in exopolysaccharide biosynthesis